MLSEKELNRASFLNDQMEEDDEFDDPDWEETTMDAMYPEGYDEDIDGFPFGDD